MMLSLVQKLFEPNCQLFKKYQILSNLNNDEVKELNDQKYSKFVSELTHSTKLYLRGLKNRDLIVAKQMYHYFKTFITKNSNADTALFKELINEWLDAINYYNLTSSAFDLSDDYLYSFVYNHEDYTSLNHLKRVLLKKCYAQCRLNVAFINAVIFDDIDEAKHMLKDGANLYFKYKLRENKTAVKIAKEANYKKMVEFLEREATDNFPRKINDENWKTEKITVVRDLKESEDYAQNVVKESEAGDKINTEENERLTIYSCMDVFCNSAIKKFAPFSYWMHIILLNLQKIAEKYQNFYFITDAEKFNGTSYIFFNDKKQKLIKKALVVKATIALEEGDKISLDDLITAKRFDAFNIIRYFFYYRCLKNNFADLKREESNFSLNRLLQIQERLENGNLESFTLYSNIGFDQTVMEKKIVTKLKTKDIGTEFMFLKNKESDIFQILKSKVTGYALIQELVYHTLEDLPITTDNLIFGLTFKNLLKYKIINETYGFHEDFIENRLPPEIQTFRQAFIDEVKKAIGLKNDAYAIKYLIGSRVPVRISQSKDYGSDEFDLQLWETETIDDNEILEFFDKFRFSLNTPEGSVLNALLVKEVNPKCAMLAPEFIDESFVSAFIQKLEGPSMEKALNYGIQNAVEKLKQADPAVYKLIQKIAIKCLTMKHKLPLHTDVIKSFKSLETGSDTLEQSRLPYFLRLEDNSFTFIDKSLAAYFASYGFSQQLNKEWMNITDITTIETVLQDANLKSLLSEQLNLNKRKFWFVLFTAIENTCENLVTILARYNIKWVLNIVDVEKKTALHHAAIFGSEAIVNLLLQPFELDEETEESIKRNHFLISDLLTYIEKVDNKGRTALDYALENKKFQIAKELILASGKCNIPQEAFLEPELSNLTIVNVLKYGPLDKLKELIDKKLILKDTNFNCNYQASDKEWNLNCAAFDMDYVKKMLNEISHVQVNIILDSPFINEDEKLSILMYQYENIGISLYDSVFIKAAQNGYLKIYKEFAKLKMFNSELNMLESFIMACLWGQLDIIKYLYHKLPKSTSKHPLRKLRDKYLDFQLRREPNIDMFSIMLDYCSNEELILTLKNDDFDYYCIYNENKTPLMLAAQRRFLKIVTYLVEEKNVNIFAKDDQQNDALHYAAQSKRFDVFDYLLQYYKKKNVEPSGLYKYLLQESKEKLLILKAIKILDISFVEYLLLKGYDVNEADDNGFTALHYGARHQNFELIKVLLLHGAKYNALDNDKKMPIFYAKPLTDVYEILNDTHAAFCQTQANFNKSNLIFICNARNCQNETLLHRVLKDNNDYNDDLILELITVYNELSPNINLKYFKFLRRKDQNGDTVLKVAEKNNKMSLIEKLKDGSALFHSMLPASKELFGYIRNGEIEKLQNYQPIDFNAVNDEDETALHIAVKSNNVQKLDMIKYLLKHGANASLKNMNAKTPIDLVIENPNYGFLRIFLNFGYCWDFKNSPDELSKILRPIIAYPDEQKNDNNAWFETLEAKVFELKKANGNVLSPYIYDSDYNTPLHYAAKTNNEPAVKLLLENGAAYNVTNVFGNTPAKLTTDSNIKDLFKLIDDLFFAVQAPKSKFLVSKAQECIVTKELFKIVTSTCQKLPNSNIFTKLLCEAVKNEKLEAISWLIEKGVDPNIGNNICEKPIELLNKNSKNYSTISKILEQKP